LKVIYIKNYTRTLFLTIAILLFWVLMFTIADRIIKNNLFYGIDEQNIQTSHTSSLPVARGFTNYKSLEGKFSFDYPSAFLLSPQAILGSDILYHIDFRSSSYTTHGFVQVWNMSGSLSDFLKNSKELSTQSYKYFKTGSIKLNGLSGYCWDYMVLSGGKYIKAMEVFLKQDDLMYRISYFVPENEWNQSQLDLFRIMARSFKLF